MYDETKQIPRHLEFEARYHLLISLGLLLAAVGAYYSFRPIDGPWQAAYPAFALGIGAAAHAFKWRPNGYARRRLRALEEGTAEPLPTNATTSPISRGGWPLAYCTASAGFALWNHSEVSLSYVFALVLVIGFVLFTAIKVLRPNSQARRHYEEAMRRRRQQLPPPAPPKPFNEAFLAKYHRWIFGPVVAAALIALAINAWLAPDRWAIGAYVIVWSPFAFALGVAGWFNWSKWGPGRREYETRSLLAKRPVPPSQRSAG